MSDTWTAIAGYSTGEYTDTMVFEVDYDTKKLQKISGQTLVAGEENSQYIRFTMPRYWDGIDTSDKTIKVIYQLTDQYFGKSEVINGEMTEDAVRFGWVVPKAACCVSGTLLFVIVVTGEDYVLKFQITELPVVKSIDPEGEIPEPTREAWYIEFQQRMEAVLTEAEETLGDARTYAEQSEASANAAANIKEDVDDTSAQLDQALDDLKDALEQVGINKATLEVVVQRLNAMVADYDASAEQEILDARVGHNGVTYGSMGEAIRGQFDELRVYVDSEGYVCQNSST